MSPFHPIANAPALWNESMKLLVIADLHIGIENELIDQGVHISSQTFQMKKQLQRICETYHPRKIMILGDIKHSIPATPFHEKRELFSFLTDLSEFAAVHIIPGNHDGGIINLIPESIRVHSSAGFFMDDIGFVHGHRWPKQQLMQGDYLLVAHSHPTIMLTDRLGFQNYEPCWIKTTLLHSHTQQIYSTFNKELKIIILPAFNQLCGGLAVNKDGLMGPLQKITDLAHADVFLLDGTHLGKVKEI